MLPPTPLLTPTPLRTLPYTRSVSASWFQHEALDAATQGFIDALNEALPGQVEIENNNASGDATNCTTIVNGYVSEGVDLIARPTPPQPDRRCFRNCRYPHSGTSITAYGLDIDDFNGTVGGNISGTSRSGRPEQTGRHDHRVVPRCQKVGLLFCSSEPNSRYQIEEVATCLANKGIETQEFAFTDTNDVASVTQSAADFSGRGVHPHRQHRRFQHRGHCQHSGSRRAFPAICGEEGICSGCGVAACPSATMIWA